MVLTESGTSYSDINACSELGVDEFVESSLGRDQLVAVVERGCRAVSFDEIETDNAGDTNLVRVADRLYH